MTALKVTRSITVNAAMRTTTTAAISTRPPPWLRRSEGRSAAPRRAGAGGLRPDRTMAFRYHGLPGDQAGRERTWLPRKESGPSRPRRWHCPGSGQRGAVYLCAPALAGQLASCVGHGAGYGRGRLGLGWLALRHAGQDLACLPGALQRCLAFRRERPFVLPREDR